MSVTIGPSGLVLRRLLRRERLVRFDELARVEGGVAITAAGERLSVSPPVAAELAQILGCFPVEGPLPGLGAAISAHLAGPHGPALAARRLVQLAEQARATDLHLEPGPSSAALRLRREGELAELCTIPLAAARSITAAWKGLAGCLPYRSDLVQEGRIGRDGVAADVRASFLPTPFGDRVALRLFGRLLLLDELGLPPDALAAFRRLLDRRSGLLVVAGATGAGKTTTLYAALAHLASARAGAHLSLEDPVEQRLRAAGVPVDQVELSPSRGVTGEAMLAAALRQDVDVISVGEIRTPAEAALAVKAAHTGRLVLAGVHAGSCAEAVERLVQLGAERELLDATLQAVIHQALVAQPCGCGASPACPRCAGIGRRRRLVVQLLERPSIKEAA